MEVALKALILGVLALLFQGTEANALSTITQVTPRNASYLGDVLQVTPSLEKDGDVTFSVCIPERAGRVKVGFVIWDKPVPLSAGGDVDRWPREGMQTQASCPVEGKPGKHARCYEVRVSREMLPKCTVWVSRVASGTAFDAWEIVLGEFIIGSAPK